MSTSNFNPRSREGSDNTRPTSVKLAGIFQSTLPRRERPAYRTSVPPTPKFQSTLPRRERRMRAEEQNAFRDFNPRSREGSDTGEQPKARISNISIHAPAKGATTSPCTVWRVTYISIHAPAKGATARLSARRTQRSRFQSTLPRRERLKQIATYIKNDTISIHAPVKGATIEIMCSRSMMPIFQSTPPRRERRETQAKFLVLCTDFNPRSREGSDSGQQRCTGNHLYFNPRSREGSDCRVEHIKQSCAHFNPRSREGSDVRSGPYPYRQLYFNPRPREGSDGE